MMAAIYIAVALALTGFLALLFWPQIKGFFFDSETIAWARLQMVAGAVLGALAVADVTPVFHALGWSRWVPLYLFASGVITEVLRRARDRSTLIRCAPSR